MSESDSDHSQQMDTMVYPMSLNREGYVGNAVIFVMHKFRERPLRQGAICEQVNLGKIAGLWRLKPCFFLDATKTEIEETLNFITNPPVERPYQIPEDLWQARILPEHNTILVAVVSHGNADCFLTVDGKLFPDKNIDFYLNEDNCHVMRGKPKIILFNKCRLEAPSEAPSDPQDSEEDTKYDAYLGNNASTNSNFMKIYSCSRGTFSLRDRDIGSFFLSALPREYEKYGGGKELRKFFQIFRSRLLKEINEELKKKMPVLARYTQCMTVEDSLLAEIFFPRSCEGLEEMMEVEHSHAYDVWPKEAWGISESSDTPAEFMNVNGVIEVAPETRQVKSKFISRMMMYKKVKHTFKPRGRKSRFRRFIFPPFK